LSGVVGIVVSVGVTVDSYVVYFERMKDEIAAGKSSKASIERGFRQAFRTILTADLASFIGAALLYMLTVGPVRGFALFLAISTLLDLTVSWWFTRPLVSLLGRTRIFTSPKVLGITRGEGTDDDSGSIWHRLFHGTTNFVFCQRTWRWMAISGAVIGIGLGSLAINGLNFGIEFRGGTVWTINNTTLTVEQVRAEIEPLGYGTAKIQEFTDRDTGLRTIQVQADVEQSEVEGVAGVDEVRAELAALAQVEVDEISFTNVGPSWGDTITDKAIRALIVFLVAIAFYMAIRLEWRMAIAGITAVIHDVIVTVGIYSLSGFEVTPATVTAFLTILGFSLYDTIVVFDRVRENVSLYASRKSSIRDIVDLSMNQVLMRSLNTSLTALLPIGSVLVLGTFFFGAATLQDFGLALFIGLMTGAYSSIFVASPILAWLKEREPKFAGRQSFGPAVLRLEGRGSVASSKSDDRDLVEAGVSAKSSALPQNAGKDLSISKPTKRKGPSKRN
jgi:preprotein translocase SecF subunit